MTAPQIGVVGADLPRQLVLAAGAVPVRIFGAWTRPITSEARAFAGATDAVALRVLDELLAGAWDHLAGLVVCNDSAANLRVFYVLRMLSERGRVPWPVLLLDAPQQPGAPRERFVAWQFERLAEFCSRATGQTIDASSLARAARSERALGARLGELAAARRAREVTGVAALEGYLRAVGAAGDVGSPVRAGDHGDRLAVVVTGSAHPDTTVYEAIEREGLIIVGDDHDTGEAGWLGAAAEAETVAEVARGLARAHVRRPPRAATSTSAARAASLRDRVITSRATGVIALARELDDAPAWDLAEQRAQLAELGVACAARLRVGEDDAAEAAASAAAELRRAREEAA